MNPLLPTILIVHAEEAIPLSMLEIATHHHIATVAINLTTLNQFQFFASQSGHGRNQFFLNNSAGQTLNLNYLHGLYAQSWYKIAQQFHQPSTSDSLYLTQAWLAFFMWLTQNE